QRLIVWIFPLFASRHALAAGGEHLTCVLFPTAESVDFFFQREIPIINQFVGRDIMGLRVFTFVRFGRTRHGAPPWDLALQPQSKTTNEGLGFRSAVSI